MNAAKLMQLFRALFAEHPTRVMLGGGVLTALAAALTMLAHTSASDGFRVLARGIRLKGDVKAITTELEKQGVSYQLSDGGRTISVPEGNFELASRQISKEKLYPRNREQDFREAMEKSSSLTMLPDMQRLQHQRIQEMEIARTISMYDSVEFARVHISQPHETMFRGPEAAPVTASIFLELSPGRKLSNDQVAAIKALVSHSVEGLSPSNITLCDSQGADYSTCGTRQTTAPVATNNLRELELAQLVETVVLGKVTDHMGRLFEPDTFAASVTAELEMSQVSMRPAAQAQNADLRGGGDGERTTMLRSGGGEERTTLLSPPDAVSAQLRSVESRGRIRRLSISVLVDSRSLTDGRLDPALRATVEAGIKAAVAFSSQRGDTLSVLAAPFIRHRPNPGYAMVASVAPPRADRARDDAVQRAGSRAASAVREVGRALIPDSRASGALSFVAANFNVLWVSQVSILMFMLALLVRQLGGAGSGTRGEHSMYPVRLDQLLTSGVTGCTKSRRPTARCLESLLSRADRDVEGALAQCDEDTLSVILRSGAESLRAAVLKRLPGERARELTERVAVTGPVPLGQVEQAQVRLADLLVAAPLKGFRSKA